MPSRRAPHCRYRAPRSALAQPHSTTPRTTPRAQRLSWGLSELIEYVSAFTSDLPVEPRPLRPYILGVVVVRIRQGLDGVQHHVSGVHAVRPRRVRLARILHDVRIIHIEG